MEHNNEFDDPKPVRREPWNKGKIIGAKPPLRDLVDDSLA